MKYTGQVKVPEVDHPGVPASFVVEEDHAEVLLDGESLGRWSLYDVQASRLISSAFSVKLGEEEVTFIADDPIEFAYRGVEQMAERWARYKSMTFPRRMFTVARSRRGTTPSRIQELRETMEENLHDPSPAGTLAEAASSVVSPETPHTPQLELPASGRELRITEPEERKPRPRLLPGPGLMAQPVAETERFASEPELETPPKAEVEPVLFDEEIRDDTSDVTPEVAKDLIGTSSATDDQGQPHDRVVDLGEFEDHPTTGGDETIGAVPQQEPEPNPEMVLATASARRSAGLLSAVRSAFVRGRESHEHEFVEAPGGIGIIRHICSECGHISISVSD